MKILSAIQLLRPHQWLKNFLLFFPPFFAGKLFDTVVRENALSSFVSFSLAASCAYIINDIRDRESDRNHAVKRHRLIARSAGSMIPFAVLSGALYISSLLIASSVSRDFEGLVIIYLLVSLSYTFFFKDRVLLDIFFISLGFLLRVLAGGEAFKTPVTNWLFLTVFLVALFLAAGKRLGELISLGDGAQNHRKNLSRYPHSFLDGILWFSASASLVTYALYTLEHGKGLFYTVPLAAFGLLRYVYIVNEGKGDPTESLLKDGQIMAVGILWAVMIGIIIYKG